MEPKELREAIKEFHLANRKRWNTKKKARNFCFVASSLFYNFLRGRGFKPEMQDLMLDDEHDRSICPRWYPETAFGEHVVVYVNGVVVDWTARQYCPDAPYPLVFVSPYEKVRSRDGQPTLKCA